jgi:hydroxymethylpyrimidine pyrophosphatase-like HAD family hydrolase
MAVRLLATDFDETVTEAVGVIHPPVVDAIRAFTAQGGTVLLASGRVLLSLEKIVTAWGVPCFLAGTNGTVLETWPDRQCLITHQLEADLGAHALDAGDGLGLPHLLYDDRLFARAERASIRYSELLGVPVHTTPELKRHIRPGLRAVSWRCDAADRSRLMDVLGQALDGRAAVTASHAVLVDVNPLPASKGEALRRVQSLRGIAPEETLSIGDSPNDESLLGAAGLRAAVANAAPGLKEIASFVATEARGRGVLECFRRFGLL